MLRQVELHGGSVIAWCATQWTEQAVQFFFLRTFWIVVGRPGVNVGIIFISKICIFISSAMVAIGISLAIIISSSCNYTSTAVVFFIANFIIVWRRKKSRQWDPNQVDQVLQHFNMRSVQEGEGVKEAGGQESKRGGAEVREHNDIASLLEAFPQQRWRGAQYKRAQSSTRLGRIG